MKRSHYGLVVKTLARKLGDPGVRFTVVASFHSHDFSDNDNAPVCTEKEKSWYIYTRMYICMYVYICVYIYIYMYACLCMYKLFRQEWILLKTAR